MNLKDNEPEDTFLQNVLNDHPINNNSSNRIETVEPSAKRIAVSGDRFKKLAKIRREQENIEYGFLSKLIPLPSAITNQLDKAAIIRLSTCFLKIRNMFQEYAKPKPPPKVSYKEKFDIHLLQPLDGFLMILEKDSKILYISESGSTHLGLSQVDMTGNSIYEFIYDKDQHLMSDLLNNTPLKYEGNVFRNKNFYENEKSVNEMYGKYIYKEKKHTFSLQSSMSKRHLFIRMRCVLAKRNASITMDGHKVIRMVISTVLSENCENFVIFAQSVPPKLTTNVIMEPYMFMLKMTPSLKIIDTDSNFDTITGYNKNDIHNMSMYSLCHVCDILVLQEAHTVLLNQGQCITRYYRFLTKEGGYTWVCSQISLTNGSRINKSPLYICLTTTLSETILPRYKLTNNDPCSNKYISKKGSRASKQKNLNLHPGVTVNSTQCDLYNSGYIQDVSGISSLNESQNPYFSLDENFLLNLCKSQSSFIPGSANCALIPQQNSMHYQGKETSPGSFSGNYDIQRFNNGFLPKQF